ncbi:alpha/beta fold hydrolase [Kocuria sp. cx-116]|uniref:alpha/beta hydrolase n=1 Tax=Kocuria sp. cx-116 TaxID=2771378 RepID=UPI0016893386|nr:alpha/beta hydrolase [Kocuria sp. cx-116]MBD2763488.1 alpha/beta fold hydrolase [Kocuria sp. cx-116]
MTRTLTARSATAALVVAALALTGCSPQSTQDSEPGATSQADPDVTAGTDSALAAYYTQELSWGDCDYPQEDQDAAKNLDCARVSVPVDYANPDAGDTFVEVSRLSSSENDPQGTLFLNPGGPGGSGVDMVLSAGFFASESVRDNYDIVGFDPRGVERSDGIDCLTDQEMDEWRAEPAFEPGTETLDDMRATYAAIGAKCHENSSPVVAHMDTQSVAKDLDVMRAVFDQPATHYLGFSYGTEIGATYARLFSQRTGRVVLDGGVDPTMDERAVTLDQAKGFEDNLRHWVQDCQDSNNRCAVGQNGVADGMAQIQDLLAKVSEENITVSDGRRITAVNAVEGILVPLYSTASYSQLNSALEKAFDGDFDELMDYSDSNHGRNSSGEYTSNVSEAFTAVNCLDTVSREISDQDMARAAETMTQEAPTFGPYLSYGDAACQGWPDEPVEPLESYTADTDQTLLVVGTTHDPATPYAWSESLVAELGNARLLTHEGWGHTAYVSGNSCIKDTVDNYLVSGAVPEQGTTCG